MKKHFTIALIFGIFSPCSHAQTLESFLPDQWEVIQSAYGDLNRDSIEDVAVIIEYRGESLEGVRPRTLLVLFKTRENQYFPMAQADGAVPDGEMVGESFVLMEIKRNVLRIDLKGEGEGKWSSTHRYRFQDEDFRVIGATYKAESKNVFTTYDFNLSTGNIIITTKDNANKANNKTVKKSLKLSQLPGLSTFEPDGIWAILAPEDFGVKKSSCVLEEASFEDCAHVIFSCGDFGSATTYLDEASQELWDDLSILDENTDPVVNPKYRGKTFEIMYADKQGIRCEAEGETTYQLVTGFRMKD